MMASMTAREYKEWEAYERAVGPLDSQYDREMLAELHELLQVNNILTGASLTKKGRKNPAGKFQKVRRPHQLFDPHFDDEEAEEPDEYDDLYDEYDSHDEGEDEEEERVHAPARDEYDPAQDPFAYMSG